MEYPVSMNAFSLLTLESTDKDLVLHAGWNCEIVSCVAKCFVRSLDDLDSFEHTCEENGLDSLVTFRKSGTIVWVGRTKLVLSPCVILRSVKKLKPELCENSLHT